MAAKALEFVLKFHSCELEGCLPKHASPVKDYPCLSPYQTCLLLRFGRKVYALKALFTLLRLRCQILRFLVAVTDFESSTIDLCDKSYRLSSKTAAE